MKILNIIMRLTGELARARAERDEAISSKQAILNELILTLKDNRRLKELAKIKQQKINELANTVKMQRHEKD